MIYGGIYSAEEAYVLLYRLGNKEILKYFDEYLNKTEGFIPEIGKNIFEDRILSDRGYFDENEVRKYFGNKVLSFISDSHFSSYQILKSFPEKVDLLVFDAHLDCFDTFYGEKYRKETWLRRTIEENLVSRVYIFGVRVFSKEEKEFFEKKGIFINDIDQISSDNLYISIDLDVLDAFLVPDVEYPEIYGIDFYDFLKVLRKLFLEKNILGFDIVEINGKQSAFVAAKIYFEILKTLHVKRNPSY